MILIATIDLKWGEYAKQIAESLVNSGFLVIENPDEAELFICVEKDKKQ